MVRSAASARLLATSARASVNITCLIKFACIGIGSTSATRRNAPRHTRYIWFEPVFTLQCLLSPPCTTAAFCLVEIVSLCHFHPALDMHLTPYALALLSHAPPALAHAVASNEFLVHALQVGVQGESARGNSECISAQELTPTHRTLALALPRCCTRSRSTPRCQRAQRMAAAGPATARAVAPHWHTLPPASVAEFPNAANAKCWERQMMWGVILLPCWQQMGSGRGGGCITRMEACIIMGFCAI